MNFLQKNKSAFVILLMVGFLVAILSLFFSGIPDPDSSSTPTDSMFQPMSLATSTGNAPSLSEVAPMPNLPPGTLPAPPESEQTVIQSTDVPLPPTAQFSVTEVFPGTDAPPPPTANFVDDGPPGTDFPPPLTFVPLPTETPPSGNGPPPGS
jgi:hypothetical protein